MNDSAPWLERELSRQLAPVAAPASLWNRIREPQRRAHRSSWRWTVWPAIAVLTLLVCMIALRQLSITGEEKLTMQELAEIARTPGEFNFRSGDFGAIRSWVKAQADVDIDMPGAHDAESSRIRLLGVRLLQVRGLAVAAIDYRVGQDMATLLVSAKQTRSGGAMGVGRHLFSSTKVDERRSLISWNMRDQNYAIAFVGAGGAHEACMLCHANMPALIAIN